MKTLYILSGFNNYYNRMVKLPGDTREDYPEPTYTLDATNFVPNDGVNTEHVVGTYDYDGQGDYLLVVDSPNQVIQRWFIIDSVRTKSGQYKLTLRRDLIADYYNIIAQSPMFIEKATVSDDDPAIYNNEGVSVNQIKTKEYALKDDSQSAWLVGYFNRDLEEKEILITYSNPTVDYTLAEDETFYEFLGKNVAYRLKSIELSFTYWISDYVSETYIQCRAILQKSMNAIHKWKIYTTGNTHPNPSGFIWGAGSSISSVIAKQVEILNKTDIVKLMNVSQMYINTGTIFQPTKCTEILKFSEKVLQTYDGSTKYQVIAAGTPSDYKVENVQNISTINNVQAVKTYLTNVVTNDEYMSYTGTPKFDVSWTEEKVFLTGTDVSFETFAFTFPGRDKRVHLNDAPYDMFCIPYKDGGLNINLYNTALEEDNKFTTMDSLASLTATQSLVEQLGTSNVYDVQLLPFCPLQGWSINADGEFEKSIVAKSDTYATDEVIYSPKAGFTIFFSTSSQGTINSEQLHLINTETNEELPQPISLGNKKISNECDMYRLCSPNYNGQFQFTASKLDGITGFNVDYTYLPYSPYIHVNPNFSGLYGKDFDDPRGLICQGDFSISYLSDAWVNYQVQNKNYANIFARQKANLEKTQEVQRDQQVFNAITGTILGGASGASTGSKAGVPGIVAGIALGTAASAIGGALDVKYGDILRNEALSYQQDMYNYQLDNIKAMPDSIAKTTAYTRNNKIFPILEYYTCTDVEKRAIANKIAYNGMTVGRIGTMNEFLNNNWSYGDITDKGYIKGQLIRFDTIDGEDFHLVNSISGELYKGVFIK